MHQLCTLFLIVLLGFVTLQIATVDGHRYGYGYHGYGQGHGHGGHGINSQCGQALQIFRQFWPQSILTLAFQESCNQVGPIQTMFKLQAALGVPVTGVLDQATFQALLNNNNHVGIAQQLLSSTTIPITGK